MLEDSSVVGFCYVHSRCFTVHVLFGCETWSVTCTGEHRLRVFENRVLRDVFVPEREK